MIFPALSCSASTGDNSDAPPPALFIPSAPAPELRSSVVLAAPTGGAEVTVAPRGLRRSAGTVNILSEGGENGTSFIGDHTGGAYPLIQSDVVSEGSFAFHLATKDGHWFEITRPIAPSTATKLFFESRLNWSTANQIARVQVSTDEGASWGNTIYTQAGDGGPGEGSFRMRELSLASFASQTIRIRFVYDFNGGSFFADSRDGVGWHVDNIQIGASFRKSIYSIGEPTNDEQYSLEFINRARAGAVIEAYRLKNETDSAITGVYARRGLNLDNIVTQFQWGAGSGCMGQSAQPLAFSPKLIRMARLHSQDMLNNMFQGHVSSDNPPPPLQPGDTLGMRRDRVGYGRFGSLSENVFAYSLSVAYAHAGFEVDWGDTTDSESACYHAPFAGQGMQNPPGHRFNIHNPSHKEAGIGIVNGTNGSVGPQIVTQDFSNAGGSIILVTGVVFMDANRNGSYDPGEGVGGVKVDIPESTYTAVTSASGGYALPLVADGVYSVTFSGGGVETTTLNATIEGGQNFKVDYLLPTIKPTVTVGYVNDIIYLSWLSQNGLSYQVERSRDLQGSWEQVGAHRVGDGSTLQQSDRVTLSRWFYRLRIYE